MLIDIDHSFDRNHVHHVIDQDIGFCRVEYSDQRLVGTNTTEIRVALE